MYIIKYHNPLLLCPANFITCSNYLQKNLYANCECKPRNKRRPIYSFWFILSKTKTNYQICILASFKMKWSSNLCIYLSIKISIYLLKESYISCFLNIWQPIIMTPATFFLLPKHTLLLIMPLVVNSLTQLTINGFSCGFIIIN